MSVNRFFDLAAITGEPPHGHQPSPATIKVLHWDNAATAHPIGFCMPFLILGTRHQLDGFPVHRLLPHREHRRVGPFLLLDSFGPHPFSAGEGMQVPPHPHIGLATLTCLFQGELMHRDSLGSVQCLSPGAVNWMCAGRGIVHSERSPLHLATQSHRLQGVQLWIALPEAQAECEPAFVHLAVEDVPVLSMQDATIRLLAGSAWGRRSGLPDTSPMVAAVIELPAGGAVRLPLPYAERALLLIEGDADVQQMPMPAGALVVIDDGDEIHLQAHGDARLLCLAGDPVGSRYLWWNFVARDRERIEQAKADWREGRFGQIAGEAAPVPLPER